MKRPKYHFLTVVPTSRGTTVVALPGQTFGRNAVPEGILVKDTGKGTELRRVRSKAKAGDVIFTTTLRHDGTCLRVKDARLLEQCDDVLHNDVFEAYRFYQESRETGAQMPG